MTLESTINENRYVGNGSTKTFAFTFKIWYKSELAVWVGDGVVEREVSATCKISITSTGGSVTFTAPPPSGQKIVIRRSMPYVQEDDYRNGTRFDAEEIEDRFDQDCAERQDLRLDIGRAFKVPITSDLTADELFQLLLQAIQALQEAGDVSGLSLIKATGSTAYRTLSDRFGDVVNVLDFGAKGDAQFDSTNAILAADAFAAQVGKPLWFPGGVYVITKSVEKQASWVGVGAPQLGCFPLEEDDKLYLQAGRKDKMPGSVILVKEGTYSTFTTGRSDLFSSFKYAVKTKKDTPSGMNGLAIVQDMNVWKNDALTEPGNDDRADDCDVGYLIDDASRCEHRDFVVFGYWSKGGTVVWSGSSGDNPDYNKFFGGSTSGYYGLALIGSHNENGPGLSGTQCFGFQIFANDHHNAERGPQTLKSYQDNGYGHCLYIDGQTSALVTNINGHYFFSGGIRSQSNRPIQFGAASNVQMFGVAFEFPTDNSNQYTTNKIFTATTETYSIGFYGCRNFSAQYISHSSFGDLVHHLTVSGLVNYDCFAVGSQGKYFSVKNILVNSEDTPAIDFTTNLSSTTSGSKIYQDKDSKAIVHESLALKYGGYLTISNGEITPSSSNHSVVGENGEADELTTINGTFVNGQRLILRQGNQEQPITIKHLGGNIRFNDSRDRILNFHNASIELEYNGEMWVEPSAAGYAFNRALAPLEDGVYDIGTPSFYVSDIYVNNVHEPTSSIDTSDERKKENIENISESLMRAWGKVGYKVFQFKDAISKKGESARLHVGVIAQHVESAFASEGLDASRYGLFCYDEWDAEYTDIDVVDTPAEHSESGEIISQAKTHIERKKIADAGNMYGIRYSEALALECAYQRWRLEQLEERVNKLTNNTNN